MLTTTSSEEAVTARLFFRVKRREEKVRSARRPKAKVAVARERPMMVRYCMCQPYESLTTLGWSTRYLNEDA